MARQCKLDATGQADFEVPLNDSLTSFRVVGIASADIGKFGSGSTTIRSTSDLMVLSRLRHWFAKAMF
jgi:hypothetical protein